MEGAEVEKGGPILGGSTAYGSAQALGSCFPEVDQYQTFHTKTA